MFPGVVATCTGRTPAVKGLVPAAGLRPWGMREPVSDHTVSGAKILDFVQAWSYRFVENRWSKATFLERQKIM